jgi:hypothetical protein
MAGPLCWHVLHYQQALKSRRAAVVLPGVLLQLLYACILLLL